MHPDLVLNNDKKKIRFRKLLSKKKDDNDHDESRVSVTDRNDSMSPSYDHESPQTPSDSRDRPEFHSPIQHTEQAMRMSEHSSPHNSLMYNTQILPPVIQNTGVTKVVAAKSTIYLYDRAESFLNWARFPQCLKTNQKHQSHPDPFYGNQVTYQSNHEQSTQVKAIEMMSRIKKEDMHCYPYSNSPANTRTVISPNTAKDESLQMTLSPQMKELSQYTKSFKSLSTLNHHIQQWLHQSSGEELTQRYVNKKFGNGMFSIEHKSSFAGKFNSNPQDVQDMFNQG